MYLKYSNNNNNNNICTYMNVSFIFLKEKIIIGD